MGGDLLPLTQFRYALREGAEGWLFFESSRKAEMPTRLYPYISYRNAGFPLERL